MLAFYFIEQKKKKRNVLIELLCLVYIIQSCGINKSNILYFSDFLETIRWLFEVKTSIIWRKKIGSFEMKIRGYLEEKLEQT
jgi:hypothetical protein